MMYGKVERWPYEAHVDVDVDTPEELPKTDRKGKGTTKG